MEGIYRITMYAARRLNSEDRVHNFTYTKAIFKLLGYGWWDQPGWHFLRILRVVLYPCAYVFLFIFTTIVTLHKPLTMEAKTKLDFTLSINSIVVSFTFIYSAFKTVYMNLQSDKVRALLMELEALGEEEGPVTEERNKALRASIAYTTLIGLTIFLWTVYFCGIHGVFPFLASFPWDDSTLFGKLASFGMDLCCATWCGLVHCAVDSVIPICVGLIRGHVAIIRSRLKLVGKPPIYDPDILKFSVELHVKLLRVARQINDAFSILFSVQSVYTVLHACILIFSVVKGGDFGGGLPMLSSAYAQFFLYSYYGQLLTDCFSDLSMACYNNRWYRSQVSVQKGICLFTLVSQKPVYLRGFGFTFKASFASYLSSLQDSVSYFLVLKTVTHVDDTNNKLT